MPVRLRARRSMPACSRAPAAPIVIVGAYYYRPVSQDFDSSSTAQFQSARPPSYGPARQRLPTGELHHRKCRAALRGQPALGAAGAAEPAAQVPRPGRTRRRAEHRRHRRLPEPGHHRRRSASSCTCSASCRCPVYSNLYGYQLFPRYTVSVGVSYAFCDSAGCGCAARRAVLTGHWPHGSPPAPAAGLRRRAPGLRVGAPAPPATLVTLDGRHIATSRLARPGRDPHLLGHLVRRRAARSCRCCRGTRNGTQHAG